MSKHPGDPTPRSAADVSADRTYRIVERRGYDSYGVPRSVIVAFHTGTETYWETSYGQLYNGDHSPADWVEVVPQIEKRTVYRRKQ